MIVVRSTGEVRYIMKKNHSKVEDSDSDSTVDILNIILLICSGSVTLFAFVIAICALFSVTSENKTNKKAFCVHIFLFVIWITTSIVRSSHMKQYFLTNVEET